MTEAAIDKRKEKACGVGTARELCRTMETHLTHQPRLLSEEETIGWWQDPKAAHNVEVLRGLDRYRGIHCGRRAFLIGTGPSINRQDLSLMKDEITFGCNGLPLQFKTMGFRTTYYCVGDPDFAANHPEAVRGAAGIETFRLHSVAEFGSGSLPIKALNFVGFSTDPLLGIFHGQNVLVQCLQLAVFMGCNPIYLVGSDLDYSGATMRFYEEDRPAPVTGGMEMILGCYRLARKWGEANGHEIFNATRGGKLEIFKRVEYESLF